MLLNQVSLLIDDLMIPEEKYKIGGRYDQLLKRSKSNMQPVYQLKRYNKTLDIWTHASLQVQSYDVINLLKVADRTGKE